MAQHHETPLEGGDGTIDDLKQALVENLEHRGVLNKLRAKVHSEIFHTLEGPQDGVLPPSLSNDNLLINELIRDYLSYNGYGNALGVFMTESGQPNDRVLDREFLRGELGLTERKTPDEDRHLPLLYGIVHALKRWKEACSKRGGHTPASGPPRGEERNVAVDGEGGHLDADLAAADSESNHRAEGGQEGFIGKVDPAPVLFVKRGAS